MDKKKIEGNILASGEVTNHHHRAGGNVSLWDVGGTMVLDAPEGSTVTHEEHKPLVLPPGEYNRHIVLEYDHFAEEAREVRD